VNRTTKRMAAVAGRAASSPAGCAGLLLAFALSLAGCEAEPAVVPTPQTKVEQLASRDDLTLALDGLRKLAQAPDQQSTQRTIFYFNQWLASAKPGAGDWKADRMLENLPLALKSTPGLERLDKLEFTMPDLRHLQTCLWAHDVAQRSRRTQVPPELAEWLKSVESQIGVTEAEQLATAERLFDWTICSMQLDPLPPPPKGPVATAGAAAEPVTPAALGEPGPGYRHMPLDLLMQGRGDAWERARVFILLCRQANIDAVMLGLMDNDSPAPRGWLPAVLLGDQLYLFDTSLGLPLPGPGGKGIAALSQVIGDPALLRQLDVEGEPPYPVTKDDLRIVALIDADPESLAHRMQLLQTALPAEQHLILSTHPSLLEPRLRKCQGVGQVSLWRVPLEAVLYTIGRMQAVSGDPEAAMKLRLELGTFDPNYPLSKGRNLHLQGRYEFADQEPGARRMYLDSRLPDQEILAIRNSEIVRTAHGLQQYLPEDPALQQQALEALTSVAFTRKHHATYWLGLTYHEAGNHSAAIEWLAERTMQAVPPSPWIPGARYNLARCYEDLGQWEAASNWLLSDKDSPQRHGNLLRAKWIAEQHPAESPQPASSSAAQATSATPTSTK
jgi:hypothetical protein